MTGCVERLYIDVRYNDAPNRATNPSPLEPSEIETQHLTRACHEALILAALARGPRHGYQIALEVEARSRAAFTFKHGTLYPILHRLEKEGSIAGAWSNEGPRGRRRAYTLTSAGKRHLKERRASWVRFIKHFRAAALEEEE